jgi:hypothetical protein
MDLIGVAIGFITVMLLLSIIVTALVQSCSYMAAMRARNLRDGLVAALELALPDKAPKTKASLTEQAMSIMEKASPLKSLGRRLSRFGGISTWIEPARLRECAKAAIPGLTDTTADDLVKRFDQLEHDLRKRFQGKMRALSVGWAVVIAIVFQVSGFALVAKLKSNAEYAKLGESMGDEAMAAHEETQERKSRAQILLEAYDETLAAQTDDEVRQALEGAVQDGKVTRPAVVAALEALPTKSADVLAAFDASVGRQYSEEADKATETRKQVEDYLSALDIEPRLTGAQFAAFYWHHEHWFRNWLGILFTAVMLSFGAPFWFQMLRNAAGLRDALKPQAAVQTTKTTVKEKKGD